MARAPDTVFFEVNVDGAVGEDGLSQPVLLAHLDSSPDFTFKPTENESDLQTIKIEDYIISNKDRSLRHLEDVRKGERLYIHGNLKSWNGGDFNYSVSGVRIRYWSFQQKEDKSAFDVYASSHYIHFLLGKPHHEYRHHAPKHLKKLDALHWLCKEVTEGEFGYHHPNSGGQRVEDFVENRDHETHVDQIEICWDFMKEKMKEQLDDDHPDWQISPLWLHLVEKFDDPIPEHRQEDDEEHGDTDIESDGWGDVGA